MKKIRYNTELLLRSEPALHFLTMFFIQAIIMEFTFFGVTIFFFPFIFGIAKELFDKSEGKKISIPDIIGTILGGYFYILIINYEYFR